MSLEDTAAFDPAELADLLRWGLSATGEAWGDCVPVEATVATFLACPGVRQEPWPEFGLELHLPAQPDSPLRVDVCLMHRKPPRRRDRPHQWLERPAQEPGLSFAHDFAFAEYDVLDGTLDPMGQFHSVTNGDENAWPEGPLRELHRCCGAPGGIGLTPGRGEGVSAVLFPISGPEAWSRAPHILEQALAIPDLAARLSGLERLTAQGATVRCGVSTRADGSLLPRGGIEIRGLNPDDETAAVLAATGASPHAIEAWRGLCARLPKWQGVDRAMPEAPALALPWRIRAVSAVHVKIGLQPGQTPLKLYLRIDSLPADEPALTRTLRAGGLTSAQIRLLAGLRADARRAADGPEDDDRWWRAGYQDLPDAGSPPPFAALLWPLLRGEWNRLVDALGPDVMSRIDTTGCDDLLRAGLKRLTDAAGPSLHHAWRGRDSAGERLLADLGIIGGTTPDDRRVELAWCRTQLRSGLAGWLGGQPAMAPRLLALVEDWGQSTRTMLLRIAGDMPDIASAFGLPADARVTAVLGDAGDRHGGGNAVQGLVFGGNTPCRIFYKPRSLQPEIIWEELWQTAAAPLQDPPPPAPRMLDRGTYGYMADVPQLPPGHRDDAERFCRNAGRMLALLYVLGAADIHAGNVVSRPEGPVLIDAELVFDGNRGPWTPDPDTPSAPLWLDSVLSTGLLPSRLRGAAQGWVDLVIPDVLMDGEALRAGFLDMCRSILDDPLPVQRAITRFGVLPRRVLLRSTTVYANLLRALRSPEMLASAEAAQTCLLPLRRGRDAADAGAMALVAAEEQALLRGDVPLFVVHHDRVFAGSDVALECAPWSEASRAEPRAMQRLKQLEARMDWQAGLVAVAGAGLGHWPRRPCPESPAPGSVHDTVARWVRDGLLADCKDHPADGRPLWLTWRWEPSLAIHTVGELPPGLYSGHGGPLAFLAAWCAIEPQDHQARSLLDRWMAIPVPATTSGIGLDGLSGTLRLARLLGQPFELHVPAFKHLLSAGPSAQPADLVSGCAGLLSALAWWEEAAGDPIATALAERLAAACCVPQVEEAPGLAHGRSGPALALMAAGVRWRNDDWLARGRALLRGIASEHDARSGGWPDGRPGHDRPMQGWCRGSAGIALAHARALSLVPHAPDAEEWRQVITLAAEAMLRASPTAMAATPLCCGSLGVAIALQVLGMTSRREDWVAAGEARLEVALGIWAKQAGRLPPGLMDGLAGLGLSALWRGEAAENFLPLIA